MHVCVTFYVCMCACGQRISYPTLKPRPQPRPHLVGLKEVWLCVVEEAWQLLAAVVVDDPEQRGVQRQVEAGHQQLPLAHAKHLSGRPRKRGRQDTSQVPKESKNYFILRRSICKHYCKKIIENKVNCKSWTIANF